MVEIAIARSGELKNTEADVVQGLVINAERLIRVLDQLIVLSFLIGGHVVGILRVVLFFYGVCVVSQMSAES